MDAQELTTALRGFFQSFDEIDRNGEPANIVDAIYSLVRAVDEQTKTIADALLHVRIAIDTLPAPLNYEQVDMLLALTVERLARKLKVASPK